MRVALLQILPVIAVVFSAVFAGCIDPCATYFKMPLSTEYGAIGDSIIAKGEAPCLTIPGLLGIQIDEQIPNAAKIGDSIANISYHYELLTRYHSPNTIITNGGVNNVSPEALPETIASDLMDMFAMIMNDGHDLIYLLQYELLGEFGDSYNNDINTIDDIVLQYCDENPMTCIDLRPVIDKNPDYFSDEIHPSIMGQHVIVDAILDAL